MHLVPLHSVLRSLAFHCFLEGGGSCRRQGKSAAPAGAGRASVVGLIRVLAASFGHDEVKRARGARVRGPHIFQPPAPRPAPLERYCKNEGSGGWGPLARSSSFAFRPRARPSARMAGILFFKGAEPDFSRDWDYS